MRTCDRACAPEWVRANERVCVSVSEGARIRACLRVIERACVRAKEQACVRACERSECE